MTLNTSRNLLNPVNTKHLMTAKGNSLVLIEGLDKCVLPEKPVNKCFVIPLETIFMCFSFASSKQTGITKNVLMGVSCKKHFAKPFYQSTALDLAALVNSLVLGSDKMQVTLKSSQ